MNMFRSRGYEINGFEIKVSRSDWLSELKKPRKADEIFSYCDKFWLVVSNKDIVQNGELPKGWGLMVLQGSRLIAKVRAERQKAKIIDLGFVASLLRNATNGMIPSNTIRQEIDSAYKRGEESTNWRIKSEEGETNRCKDLINKFEKESGVKITGWCGNETPEKVGSLLRRIFAKEKFETDVKYNLDSIEEELERTLEKIKNYKLNSDNKK